LFLSKKKKPNSKKDLGVFNTSAFYKNKKKERAKYSFLWKLLFFSLSGWVLLFFFLSVLKSQKKVSSKRKFWKLSWVVGVGGFLDQNKHSFCLNGQRKMKCSSFWIFLVFFLFSIFSCGEKLGFSLFFFSKDKKIPETFRLFFFFTASQSFFVLFLFFFTKAELGGESFGEEGLF